MTKPSKCFDCADGKYTSVTTSYEVDTQDGNKVTVPNVTLFRCGSCGAELLPPESLRRINAIVAAETDQFSRKQLYRFLEEFEVTQAEAAEAIGLGAKTINRWLRGTQAVSRSMGYYLRALMAFPEVFEWVRRRAWRTSHIEAATARASSIEQNARLQFHRFPALEKRRDSLPTIVRCNPAAGLLFAVVDRR
jgi:YgiT-type zinc finger domain-containing protein